MHFLKEISARVFTLYPKFEVFANNTYLFVFNYFGTKLTNVTGQYGGYGVVPCFI